MKYPFKDESPWIASNRTGQVAFFITAGEGPIPIAAFDAAYPSSDDICDQVTALPVITQGVAVCEIYHMPEDIELCAQGVFSYDWSEIYARGPKGTAYDLLARPEKPLHVSALPEALRAAARRIVFPINDFATFTKLDVEIFMPVLKPDVWSPP